ncbi:hypothetical protein [uncultured Shewanella sp.]|uniref:hypothetical protein n=1 Tax=uncultured Shewanella sp. TaxID=173975 RepID=UPI0026197058|nr:hypothetical protein [uncultured Shewanella sp.]
MDFVDPIECYQAIANALNNDLQDNWQRIDVVYERLSDTHTRSLVEYLNDESQLISIGGPDLLGFYFDDLAELVSTKEKGLYKKCFFTLFPDGEFDVKFEYD